MAFGLTNCNPASINVKNLPEDSDLLLDRPEYWVVAKDVAGPTVVGDELSFQVNPDGSVEYSKNGGAATVVMHVDLSRPLWPFWDLFGHTSKLSILGTVPASSASSAVRSNKLQSPDSGIDLTLHPDPQQPLSECVICFEQGRDVLHMYICINS
jgi:protein neuralized